ncbi:MAG: hypothetical protein WB347_11095, partial [Terriglobales bacterium]
LRKAGCPIDWDRLPTVSYPLDVETMASPLPTNVFPFADATAIVLPVKIRLSAPLLIDRGELRADWLPQSVSWLKTCDRHLWLPRLREFSVEISHDRLRNWFLLNKGPLKPAGVTEGFLMGMFPGTLPATTGAKLEATLVIHSGCGDQYPFSVSIDNTKLPPRRASSISDHSEATTAAKGERKAASQATSTSDAADGAGLRPSPWIATLDRLLEESEAAARARKQGPSRG